MRCMPRGKIFWKTKCESRFTKELLGNITWCGGQCEDERGATRTSFVLQAREHIKEVSGEIGIVCFIDNDEVNMRDLLCNIVSFGSLVCHTDELMFSERIGYFGLL